MRPAGATLRLFAQWLRPTTNKGKTNWFASWLFLPTTACLRGFRRVQQVCGRGLDEPMLSMVATCRNALSRSGASIPRTRQAPLNSSTSLIHIVDVPVSFAITRRPRVRRVVHSPGGVAPQRLQRSRPAHALAFLARTPAASAQGGCQRL